MDAGSLRLTFTDEDDLATEIIDLGRLSVGDADDDLAIDTAESSISGYFFDRGDSGTALRARAVAGNIYWDASGMQDYTPSGADAAINFLVTHEMTGVFLLER